jgi:hypothetical protein
LTEGEIVGQKCDRFFTLEDVAAGPPRRNWTRWGQEDDKRRATETGFDRHLTRPVDPTALEALLAGSESSGAR